MSGMAGLLLAVALVLVLWWMHSRDRRRSLASGFNREEQKRAMHCVEVRHRGRACEQARHIARVRFLPEEAPRLPLRGCTARTCRCYYVHYDDRRQAERRNPYGRSGSQPPAAVGAERRSMPDRRDRSTGDIALAARE